MKISIIGNTGSGKTTLAKQIAEKLQIPHIQLDRIWFEGGGKELGHHVQNRNPEKWERTRTLMREKVDELTRQSAWVSDGWYQRLQPMITERADALLFLDIPLWRRIFNHARRMFFSERHQELSKWDDFKFFAEIIRRRFSHDPHMSKFVAEHRNKAVVLHGYNEIKAYLAGLK